MLALVLAMISLSPDPDPLATPVAALHDRLTPGSGFASDGAALAGGLTADIDVAPACTFGAPRFGTGLWNAAEDLSRTFSQPACSPLGTSALGFASGLPLSFGSVWSPAFGAGFLQFNSAGLNSAAFQPPATAVFRPSLPARFTAPVPVVRAQPEAGERTRSEGPVTIHPRSVSGGAAQRAH